MSLHDSKARLGYAGQRLALHWQETLTDWRDPKSRDMEKEYLAPLESHLAAAVGAIDRLAETLARAERDCQR
jgi:hypothetical protein